MLNLNLPQLVKLEGEKPNVRKLEGTVRKTSIYLVLLFGPSRSFQVAPRLQPGSNSQPKHRCGLTGVEKDKKRSDGAVAED